MSERDKELLVSIEIKEFSEYVQVSQKRRAKPYIQGKCRVPKKYQGDDYQWVKKNGLMVLSRVSDGIILVSNSNSVGKPRFKKVNGQDIYNGNISRQARAALVKAIHEYFKPYLQDIEPIEDIDRFPLHMYLKFYMKDQGSKNIDNDNKWIWRKCIQDTLTELGKIPDDNPHIISKNTEETILLPSEEAQSLVIELYGNSKSNI